MDSIARKIAADYAAFPVVEAVTLAGSRTSSFADESSDYDIYVYLNAALSLEDRARVAELRSRRPEIGNHFWEPGDEWIERESGARVDVMFRHTHWIEDQIRRVLVRHEASIGYTTAFWHNVRSSQTLFDRTSWFARVQAQSNAPYPEPLRRNIVRKNHPILRNTQSSYRYQIERALRRNDPVSVNHRVTALLAGVFDILFAVNRVPHPGEKRLLQWVALKCPLAPKDFDACVRALLTATGSMSSELISQMDHLLDGLDGVLRSERLI